MDFIKRKKWYFIIVAIMNITHSFIGVIFALVLQITIDTIYNQSLIFLRNSLLLLLLIGILDFCTGLAKSFWIQVYTKLHLVHLKNKRFKYILDKESISIKSNNDNDLSFFTTDIDILSEDNIKAKARITGHISSAIFSFSLLIYINWVVTVVVIMVSIVPILISNIFSEGLNSRRKKYSDATAHYIHNLTDMLVGKSEIVSYNKSNLFFEKHNTLNLNVENKRMSSSFLSSIANSTITFANMLTIIATIGTSLYFIISGSMSVGEMFAVTQLMNSLMYPMRSLAFERNCIKSTKSLSNKSNQEITLKSTQKEQTINFSSKLELKDISISYKNDVHVVQNISMTFQKGKKYAIIAPSGSGKTSLMKAIVKKCDYNGEGIFLDSRNLKEISKKELSTQIKFVRQNPYIFKGSILDNITFFRTHQDECGLETILTLTGIKSNFSIEELNREIENFDGISGGQRQRIVLARALLDKPSILILDEITSNLDLESSIEIIKNTFVLNETLTCITITHEKDERFLSLFDEIIELPYSERKRKD